ncbi:MAG: hypothetical protein HC923_12480, partial [Myxococcales bacterium]|nr:hypothetical protein [Myxococcales bacterium]
MRWARNVDPLIWYEGALLQSLPRGLKVGDVLHLRRVDRASLSKDEPSKSLRTQLAGVPQDVLLVALEQEPALEAALLSQAVDTGYVLAMVGGYAFDRSEFNRALQACRQPGSSFKPYVYATAFAGGVQADDGGARRADLPRQLVPAELFALVLRRRDAASGAA